MARPRSALAQSRVSPFTRAAGVPERWNVPDLFLDLQNPFVPLIASCSVRNADGEIMDIDLRWRRIRGVPSTFGADLSAAVFGPSCGVGSHRTFARRVLDRHPDFPASSSASSCACWSSR